MQPNIIGNKLNKSNTASVANARPNKKSDKSKIGKLSKSRNLSNNRTIEKPKFLISKAKEVFNHLK